MAQPRNSALVLRIFATALSLAACAPPVAAQDCLLGMPLQTLENPAPDVEENFGESITVSGDLAIVGAPQDSSGGIQSVGAAYAFNAQTGLLLSTLNNPSPAEFDFFGAAVGLSGNLAVVGCPGDKPAGLDSAGRAYVFNTSSGSLLRELANPTPAEGEAFGVSISMFGGMALVGAPGAVGGAGASVGAAYLFDANAGELRATLNNPTPAGSDFFGASVAVHGKLALVGAWGDDSAQLADAGAAYVFNVITGALVATLRNPSPVAGEFFGREVAIYGGLAAVAAPGSGEIPGAAYIFDAATGAFIKKLINPKGTDNKFGFSVGIAGTTVIVGAPDDELFGVLLSGAVFLFDARSGELLAAIDNPQPTSGAMFGGSVAIGEQVIAAGAFGHDSGVGLAHSFVSCSYGTPGRLFDVLLGRLPADPNDDINDDTQVDVADFLLVLPP